MCQADFELQFCPLGDLAKRLAKVQIKEIPPPPSPQATPLTENLVAKR